MNGRYWLCIAIHFTLCSEIVCQVSTCLGTGCFPPATSIFQSFSRFPLLSLSVSSVCGSGSTTQYRSLDTSDTAPYTCNASALQPKNLYDDDTSMAQPTYWQSELMIDSQTGGSIKPQYITVNFTDEFLIQMIDISFTTPFDKTDVFNTVPSFIVLKLDLSSSEWTPLYYFSSNCQQTFPNISLSPRSPDFSRPFCYNVKLEIDLNEIVYPWGPYDTLLKNNMATISKQTASAIKFYFTAPVNRSPMMSYVAVDNLDIYVRCKCFGHAATCSGPNGAGCNCLHNTTGQHCETCLPLYNNKPWLMGNSTHSNECEACLCNGHATSCAYDQVKGRGVCNCSDNTTGDNCDTCMPGYYFNPRYGNSSVPGEPFCLACNCSNLGTLPTALNTCNVTTGQCACKERATQRDCSECRDTFWGLSAELELGCNACTCNASGVVNNTNNCNKNTGQCACKVNIEGDTCGQCKNLTYGFNANNPLGCSPCNCDPGASQQLNCALDTGVCTCFGDFGGRDCRSLPTGKYVPRLDVIVLEPETYTTENVVLISGHGTPTATVSGTGLVNVNRGASLTIPFTSKYSGLVDCVVRYEKTINDNMISLTGSLTSLGTYDCSGSAILSGQIWALAFSETKLDIRGGVTIGRTCLNSGTNYTLTISNSGGTALLVDSIVFIPTISPEQFSNRIPSANVSSCLQMTVNSVRSSRSVCASIEYSIMAFQLKGTLACNCLSGATNGTVCDSFSGDCYCVSGFLPPDCLHCASDRYQLPSTSVCIACDCNKNGSLSDLCDRQGICSCRPNVQGLKCDACLQEYFGLHTGNGCSKCQCTADYSLDNICDDYGNCHCKPGIKGPLCIGCADGYFNLTTAGCTKCNCSTDGSTGRACDLMTGLCQCLPRVQGSSCSQCRQGYFGLGKWNADGCIQCFCWGHSGVCFSSSGWYSTSIISNWLLSGTSTDVWAAQDATGNTINVLTANISTQYVMRLEKPQLSTQDIYFIASKNYLGDHKSSYGRYLTLTLSPSGSLNSSIVQVVITGLYSNYTLIYLSSESHINNSSAVFTVKIPLIENVWQVMTKVSAAANSTNFIINSDNTFHGNATYYQMMETLSSVASFGIRVYKANSSDQALDLVSVTLESATTDGQFGVSVNNIEMCTCPTGYTGSSCQQCAPGYTRVPSTNSHPATQCVPCSCNGHAVTPCDPLTNSSCQANSTVTPCDPTTGVCTCQHHSKGDHCEACVQGYYGDQLRGQADDCKPCACPGVIVRQELNVFANSCSLIGGIPVCDNCTIGHAGSNCQNCSDGYFGTPENVTNAGGQCRPCMCNGRADTCDRRTGQCINCKNNTAGQNCGLCAPGYYGDAMSSDCKPCVCSNMTGSTGQCNHTSGVCECLPNVIGASCDQCADMTFNLTANVGCQPCNCNTNGSTSLVCDKSSGQCPCKTLVTGRSCSSCPNGYWNINTFTGCDPCTCDETGTLKYTNGSVQESCDVQTGQCSCAKPGIIGRTCNTCSPASKSSFQYVHSFYLGTFPDCVLCGNCFDSWGDKINKIGSHLTELESTVGTIWNDYNNQSSDQISSALTLIEDNINKTTLLLASFEEVAQELKSLKTKFSEAQVVQDALVIEINTLNYSESNLQASVGPLLLLTDAVNVSATSATSLATLRQQLSNLMVLAETSQSEGNSSYSSIQTLTFVVASPEERQLKLQNQANQSMVFAAAINQTYLALKSLYDTSLIPGTTERNIKLNDVDSRLTNVSLMISNVSAFIVNVTRAVDNITTLLSPLVSESTRAETDMLNGILMLE
ncbi:laminin-like protein lam-2, partial [Biomphalaria pfeifferi]